VSSDTTLLLVDVQEDFLARSGLTPDRASLVATLSSLVSHARSSGWTVVHVHSRVDAGGANAMPHRRHPERVEVVAGTPGAEPPAELAPLTHEPVLFKRFFSAFDADGLEETLQSSGTRRLVVAGVHSHACIRDTVDDAYRRGFEVVIPAAATASYDAAHAAMAFGWIDGRAARIAEFSELVGAAPPAAQWIQRDPCDQAQELRVLRLTPPAEVHETAALLAKRQRSLEALALSARRERLVAWQDRLLQSREVIREALVRDVAKPLRDAESELDYGLALLGNVIKSLADEENAEGPQVNYRPRGLVGLITPWNNPFAIPVGKIAPALGYGNAVMWKPALPATHISELLAQLIADAGLGEWLAMVAGGSGAGDAIVGDPHVAAISFTGSVPVGRQLIARAGVRANPALVQAELGGSNAAIVDSSADIDMAATDLAAAMFSFSGQRCTAVRRIIVLEDVAGPFAERLIAAVRELKTGVPSDPACDIGPLIDRASQSRILAAAESAVADGGKLLCGGSAPPEMPDQGCWIEPTLIDGLRPDHPLNQQEWFGPIGSIMRATDFNQALELHNHSEFGLLGALYATDETRIEAFAERAEAGLLSIGRARPPFAAAGPFTGLKASGYGIPEHGRWNRDFYAQPQAVYRA
jgi:acyl-CoA reductase-like NAD-dependent aldehyde dehydrogenase